MRVSVLSMTLALLAFLALPAPTYAGMPSLTLSDMARLRVQSISFFLVGFLVSAWVIQLLWNSLRKDFSILPRLSYFKSLALTAIWGLMFVLVLTMISGARELMTPGAWKKDGVTYKLNETPKTNPPADSNDHERRLQLSLLWTYLAKHAQNNDGQFPSRIAMPDIPKEAGQIPHPSKMTYIYHGGTMSFDHPMPLAFEPELFGAKRLVLFTNGSIQEMDSNAIVLALREKQQ